jgi:two-component system, OmpR family, sensor kinase
VTSGISVRARLLFATVGVVSLALAIGVTAFNVFLAQRLTASATATAKAQAEAELSSLRVANARVVSPEGPDEGTIPPLTWVYEGTKTLEAPRAKKQLNAAARALAGAPEGARSLGEDARLYAIPIVQGAVRYGTVVAAVPLGPYRETAQTALIGSIGLAALLLATMTALAWWMLGRALLPVQRMTESAAQWSEHDLDNRFELGEPRDEFTRLAATLDSLLERIAESLRHEQRFTAEISHELRTPLARVKGETELLLRRPRTVDEQHSALEEIARSVDEMTATVDALVSAARDEAGHAQVTSDLRDAVRAAAGSTGRGRPTISVTATDRPVRVAAEPELLTRIVQPLIDNACRYARSTVDVEVTRNASSAYVHIDDDGPGVRDDEVELIFEPGRRGAAATDTDGAGLGLALARRLARSVGGDVTVESGRQGGHFSIRLPVRA